MLLNEEISHPDSMAGSGDDVVEDTHLGANIIPQGAQGQVSNNGRDEQLEEPAAVCTVNNEDGNYEALVATREQEEFSYIDEMIERDAEKMRDINVGGEVVDVEAT